MTLDPEHLGIPVRREINPGRSVDPCRCVFQRQAGLQMVQASLDMLAGAEAVHAEIDALTTELPPDEIADFDRISHAAQRMDIEIREHRITFIAVLDPRRFLLRTQTAARDLVLVRGAPIVDRRQVGHGPGRQGSVAHRMRVCVSRPRGKESLAAVRSIAQRTITASPEIAPDPVRMLTSQFYRLFLWHVVRNARRHPLLAGLNVLSVALGVSVYLAIQIANHSANQSFAASIDLVAGKANLEARSASGTFDETLFPKLAHAPGVKAATPLVEGYATLPDFPGEYLQVLGVDIYTNPPFATFAIGGQSNGDWANLDLDGWLGDPHALAITDEFAHERGLQVGDPIRLQINGREQVFTVRFLIRLTDTAAGRGNSRIAAMDIGWAQELFQRTGRLSSVQLLLDHPAEAETAARALAKLVPADVTISTPGARSGQVERMLSSFQLNLSALSLISLLVGMFLIYNTITASVVRRRIETGILRAVGASRLEVQCLFLAEALLFGVIGVALGIVGGTLLARFLLGREIAKVISTLYLLVSVDRFYLTPLLVGSAFFFGLGSVLAAAWLPAREGSRADPIAALSLGLGATMSKSRQHLTRWLLAGVLSLLLAVACSVFALVTGPAWLGFGSAFFVLLGFAFTAPAVTVAGARTVGWFAQWTEARLERGRLANAGRGGSFLVAPTALDPPAIGGAEPRPQPPSQCRDRRCADGGDCYDRGHLRHDLCVSPHG